MLHQDIIKKMADDIREKMVGGTLFGEPIDLEDNDAMIVAAYGVAQNEEISNNLRESKILRSLRRLQHR